MAKSPEYMYSVLDKKPKGAVFVNGNTKNLSDLNQQDMEVLFNNGDAKIERKKTQEPKAPKAVEGTDVKPA